MENFHLFILTTLAIAILPGADFALVTKNTLAAGRKEGQATALGVASGLLIHSTAAILGLSAIIAQSAMMFEFIKYIGAAYLCYIGITTFLTAEKSLTPIEKLNDAGAVSPKSLKSCFLQGTLSNALNPKVAIFYLTLLPQFVTSSENSLLQLVILGLTAVLIGLVWYLFLAYAFNYVRAWFAKPLFRSSFQRIIGLMLISFGIKLALTEER